MGNLTWDDLLVSEVSESEARLWLEPWSCFVHGPLSVVCLSKFGDWFLRRPDGSTDELSILEGSFSRIADTPEEFSALLNSVDWQEEHLLSYHVYQLHERGLIPKRGECYAFAPPPMISGVIDIASVSIMSMGLWQSICGQVFHQLEADA